MLRKRCADPGRDVDRWRSDAGAGASPVAGDAAAVARGPSPDAGVPPPQPPVRTATWLGGAVERMRWRRASDGRGETTPPSSDSQSYAESFDWRDDDDDDVTVAKATPGAPRDDSRLTDDASAGSDSPTAGRLPDRHLQHTKRYTLGEMTSQNLWPRQVRHFVGASRLRFEPGASAPEPSTLTTRLPSHHIGHDS